MNKAIIKRFQHITWILLVILVATITVQAESTSAVNPCQEPGSSCSLALCLKTDKRPALIPCPEMVEDELLVNRIEYQLQNPSNPSCRPGVPCLVLNGTFSNEAITSRYVSLINSIKDEINRRVRGHCDLGSLSILAQELLSFSNLTGHPDECQSLKDSKHGYRLNIVLSRKAAPTVLTTTTTARATTATKPSKDPTSCPAGYVFVANQSGHGGSCEYVAVSGDACQSLASITQNVYQREFGDCVKLPDTEAGLRKALAETRNSSVIAQVLSRFANASEFKNATEASRFADLLELEAASACDNITATPAGELRQTVSVLLDGVTAFATKEVWSANLPDGEGESKDEAGKDGEGDERRLAKAAGAVMRALDSLGRGLQFAVPEVDIGSRAIAMSVRRVKSGSATMHSNSAAVKVNLIDSAPANAFASPPVSMVTCVVNLPGLIRRLGNAGRPVASQIVQATLYSADSGARLTSPVRVLLLLPHLADAQIGASQRRCVFLEADASLSERGCRPVAELSDASQTACSCEHLTSFAAVVLPGTTWLGPETHRLWRLHSTALRVLTYICLGASIACLLVTNITYLAIKLRGPLADKSVVTLHRVHHSLCFALLVAHALYLLGFNPPTALGHLGCQILSGLTLYALLCVFFWLLCEGIMYAKSLIIVLPGVDSAFGKVKFQHYCLLSYLAPAIIVAITAGLRHQQLIQLESPSLDSDSPAVPQPKACWLSEELGTNYAFLAPMLLVCLANLFVFIIVLVKLTQRDAVRCPNPDLLPYLRRQVKLSVTLAGLLGLTWLLGLVFYFAHTHLFVAVHYAFTLLNGLQGCFIFFTQIFAHDRIRDGWEKCLMQSRCTPQCLRAWLQNRRHARMSGTGGSSQSKNAAAAGRKAKVTPGGNNKSSNSGSGSGGSIPSFINLLRRLSLRRRNNNSNTTGVSELSPMCKNSAAGGSGVGCAGGGGGGGSGYCDDDSQPFLSTTRDDSSSAVSGGRGGYKSHRPAPLVTEENFTSTCPPPESGFFESQLATDDQSLFDITHSLAEPALAPLPPVATLPERVVGEDYVIN